MLCYVLLVVLNINPAVINRAQLGCEQNLLRVTPLLYSQSISLAHIQCTTFSLKFTFR